MLAAGKNMELSTDDKAAVDKVCAAVAKCVVLVVSGRPLVIHPAQLAKVDALVASWLPGARVRASRTRCSANGRSPASCRSLAGDCAQEPINVGDANYDPLYRYGHGLRTR